jgi:hypothetical protein
MSGSRKQGNLNRENLLRYLRGEMTDKERHALEREFQKDMFLSEAQEGLSELSMEEVMEDLDILEGRLQRKTSRRTATPWIRWAAAAAVLITIGTLYFTVFSDRLERGSRMAVETGSPEPSREEGIPDIMDDQEEAAPPEIPETRPYAPLRETAKAEREAPAGGTPEPLDADRNMAEDGEVEEQPDEDVSGDQGNLQYGNEVIEFHEEDLADAKMAIEAEETAGTSPGVRFDTIIINQPGLADQETVTTEEFEAAPAMAQSRARKTEIARPAAIEDDLTVQEDLSAAASTISVFLPDSNSARPVGGEESFRQYIGMNMRIPTEHSTLPPPEVLLGFTVDPNGRPVEIEVIESAGDAWSREAVRLLKEGPGWAPVRINGVPVQGRSWMQIIFPPVLQ